MAHAEAAITRERAWTGSGVTRRCWLPPVLQLAPISAPGCGMPDTMLRVALGRSCTHHDWSLRMQHFCRVVGAASTP
jgi:hypothetical protein